MNKTLLLGIMLPFIGTSLGAAMVYILKNAIGDKTSRMLTGFAAGIMMAASFWSLLEPAIEQSQSLGRLSFLPSAVGFLLGIGFLLCLDLLTPHMHMDMSSEGPEVKMKKTTKLILAVTLHNIPEGMATGIVFAGWMSGNDVMSLSSAMALSIGIAIQNFPEGAIVSMPLRAEGMNQHKTFLYGVLSGAVEPAASILTIYYASTVVPLMPYLLAFAAGAMMYVIVEELIPEMSEGEHSNVGTIAFALGFVIMMILDVSAS